MERKYRGFRVVSQSSIDRVYTAFEKKTGNRVHIREFFDCGIVEGVKEAQILTDLRSSDFVVNIIEKLVTEEASRTRYRAADAASVVLVKEALPESLADFRSKSPGGRLSPEDVKTVANQLLQGLGAAHKRKIFVRNLNPANIQVSTDPFQLKLSDFAAAKVVQLLKEKDAATPPKDVQVEDLRYQAPEMLAGCRFYTEAVDLWAVGCIIVELITGVVLFDLFGKPDESDDPIEHLRMVFNFLGSPSVNLWPATISSSTWESFPRASQWEKIAKCLKGYLREDSQMVDLVKALLSIDPSARISAAVALERFF